MFTRVTVSVNSQDHHLQAFDNYDNEIYLGHNVTAYEFLQHFEPIKNFNKTAYQLYEGCNNVTGYMPVGYWVGYCQSYKLK